ncbi:MAG: tRNA (adenosine(37)-N6)-dimethylallyltransferase MiaA [Betaproteobacteria bacterium]|nr:tRNA (adenosine(37)-N6)-dimethylallyltransferase MiaA [Betaproteobacteria bacterium]
MNVMDTARSAAGRAIMLMGPTACGKTDVAVALAQRFPLEIISVDSAMVYRDMDIGTAKPDAATLARAPHHLIDCIDPDQSYSAAQFCEQAWPLMQAIAARGRIPLLVGGTMLYFRALREGLSDFPPADAALRAEIDAQASQRGWAALHAELAAADPLAAARISNSDAQRIQRALEILRLTGRPMSSFWDEPRAPRQPMHWLPLALMPADRAQLHERIGRRFVGMLADGLVAELEALRSRYALHAELPSMRCVGYRQAWACLEGEYGREELRDRGIYATRQLAKRQMTWLRGMHGLQQIDCLSAHALDEVIAAVAGFVAQRPVAAGPLRE